MKRLIFVALAFLFGCNGVGGSGASRFLPAGPGASAPDAITQGAPDLRRGEKTKVQAYADDSKTPPPRASPVGPSRDDFAAHPIDRRRRQQRSRASV